MKITHVCLCGPVTDGFSYQDNLLPKYHSLDGHNVTVITSQSVWGRNGKLEIDNRREYYNEYGIKVIRLLNKIGKNTDSKFKTYRNVYNTLKKTEPDILFVHGVQFLDIFQIVRYKKKHPKVRVFVDNHADFSNSATNLISKMFLHGIIWRSCATAVSPYVEKFFGVLPSRVDFLSNVYKISENKVELLLLGADDDKIHEAMITSKEKKIREKYNIKDNDFLILTGGKIDSAKKQVLNLIRVLKKIDNKNVKLLIFGSIEESLQKEFFELIQNDTRIVYIKWLSANDAYDYYTVSDLAVFPGRHSVIWEQLVGSGIPLLVKYWEGTNHVDLGGNCDFLYSDNIEELEEKLLEILNNDEKYKIMKSLAVEVGMNKFSYRKISRDCINSK